MLGVFILLDVPVLALGAAIEEARCTVPEIELRKAINLDHCMNLVFTTRLDHGVYKTTMLTKNFMVLVENYHEKCVHKK